MTTISPLSTFDTISIGNYLQKRNGAFASAEVYLLAYLGCLLFVYKNNPLNDWGYRFISTKVGSPYSAAIDASIQFLKGNALIRDEPDSNGRMTISDDATIFLNSVGTQSIYQTRIECIQAAASSLSTFPIGIIKEALDSEPDLKRVKAINATRTLLDEPALSDTYAQFDILRRALGNTYRDLRIPASVWLGALYEESAKDSYA